MYINIAFVYAVVLGSCAMESSNSKYCSNCGREYERFLTVETASMIFDLSPNAIRGLIKRREIPFYKMGTRVRLSYHDITDCLVRYPALQEVKLDLGDKSSYHDNVIRKRKMNLEEFEEWRNEVQ